MQHSLSRVSLASLALVGFWQASAFAGVLTVAPAGAQYTQIQAAVNAAVSDDVILISTGNYSAVRRVV